MNTKKLSNDVYECAETYPAAGENSIRFLEHALISSERKRSRICFHKSNNDLLHEMFIAFEQGSYIRPSHHVGKDESLHMLTGKATYCFFDSEGKIIDAVPIGEFGSDRQFYCRITQNTDHALILESEKVICHETTSGPFNRNDTVFCAWSPEESSHEVRHFLNSLNLPPPSRRPLLKMKKMSDEVYQAHDSIISIGNSEIDFLKSKVHESSRKRVRLCIHDDIDSALHEMFVVYMDQTYVRPNLHVGKDESLHILEGTAEFYFFDNVGNVVKKIPLGDKNSSHDFYVRVPANTWHTIVMTSKTLVIHEATPGPFRREDTLWAEWAPAENDGAGIMEFLNKL